MLKTSVLKPWNWYFINVNWKSWLMSWEQESTSCYMYIYPIYGIFYLPGIDMRLLSFVGTTYECWSINSSMNGGWTHEKQTSYEHECLIEYTAIWYHTSCNYRHSVILSTKDGLRPIFWFHRNKSKDSLMWQWKVKIE